MWKNIDDLKIAISLIGNICKNQMFFKIKNRKNRKSK
jgi:hypothetical protein